MKTINETFLNEGKENVRSLIQILLRNFDKKVEGKEAFAVKYKLDNAEMEKITKEMKEKEDRLRDTSSLIVAIMSHGNRGTVLGELPDILLLSDTMRL